MHLTMNSTIIEFSVHACNFVLKVLHREEPGARVWSKLMLKLQPKIGMFSKTRLDVHPSHLRVKMALDHSRLGLETKSGRMFCVRQVCFTKS